jgi:hypothetical protein
VFAWAVEAPLLAEALLLVEAPLLDVLGLVEPEPPDELQAASVRAPVASSTPIAVGLANREDLAQLVLRMRSPDIPAMDPTCFLLR